MPAALISKNKDIRFEALFNSASFGIIVMDQEGYIVLSNHYSNHLFGYTEISMDGEMVEKLIPQRFHQKHIAHRAAYANNPEARAMGMGMILTAIKKDGTEFPVEISLGHFKTNEEQFVIAYIADITNRKQSEAIIIHQKEDLEAINEEMKQLNVSLEVKVKSRTVELENILAKLEASKEVLTSLLEKEKEVNELKSRFVSMASHEFRTPLSTILSSTALLSKYSTTEDQPKRDKHIDRIKSSVKTLTEILNEFLSLGKIEEGKVEVKPYSFDLPVFISDVLNEMNVLLKQDQNFQYTHTGSPITYSDGNIIKHILMNLISNAIKFSPENSIIHIVSKIENETTMLQISDQGLGIPLADQARLFEQFFRASNVTNIQGTGLGLHIVGRYVNLLKGTIHYSSELANGSTFTISFPSKLNNAIN